MRKIPLADLAFAYELRTIGCRWQWIAEALGVDPEQLRYAVRWVKRAGIKNPAEAGSVERPGIRQSDPERSECR